MTTPVESGRGLFIAMNPAVAVSTASLRKKIHRGSFGLESGEFMEELGRPAGFRCRGKQGLAGGEKFVRPGRTGLKVFAAPVPNHGGSRWCSGLCANAAASWSGQRHELS